MTEPANLILLQSDSHNQRLLGCYGHPVVQTPHLDRIAAAGVRFENAYAASPLCSPSRAALATGRYPHQTGYWDNCLAYDGRMPGWMHRLREQGHTVVSVGKLHFRSSEDDNGYSREIAPMHIVDGVGGLAYLLRWNDEEPVHRGQWALYAEETGTGTTDYQAYDREITRLAQQWLAEEAPKQTKPWVLHVSYASPHPPFTVPERFWELYPPERMPLPAVWRPGERPEHPAYQHLRRVMGFADLTDAALVQRVMAGYCGLITHMDEQMGQVMDAAERHGLLETTRLAYTSDHGESFGNHGLFGKFTLLENAVAVPLLISGPGVPAGKVSDHHVSHVDLFPTFVEGAGARLAEGDADLPGESLWPAIEGEGRDRIAFAEYHGTGSRAGMYMLREGNMKLIHHAGDMPPELYELGEDPNETSNLADGPPGRAMAGALTRRLRDLVDPDEADARAKADQRARAEAHGGNEAIRKQGVFTHTPPPGVDPTYHSSG